MIVYVSYNIKDYEIAQALAVELGTLGHHLQFEQKVLGGQVRWHDVFASIEACDLYVLVVSQWSLDSYASDLEYSYANALGKRVLLVSIDHVDQPLLPAVLSAIPYIHWQPQDRSSRKTLVEVLKSLPPRPEELPAAQPDIFGSLDQLRDRATALPPYFEAQVRIVDNLKEFLEREETFYYALSLLDLLYRHQQVHPQVAQSVGQTFRELNSNRTKRDRSTRVRRWVRDIVLLAVGALAVLGIARGMVFLRPYLGLSSTATPSVEVLAALTLTPEALTTVLPYSLTGEVEVTAEGTDDVEPTEEASALENTEAVNTAVAIVSSTITPLASRTPQPSRSATLPAAGTLSATATPSTGTLRPDASGTRNALVAQSTATSAAITALAVTVAASASSDAVLSLPAVYTGILVEDTDDGVQITDIGNTATQAGVQVGDYVIAADVEMIASSAEFQEVLSAYEPASQVTLRLRRSNVDIFIRLTLSTVDFTVPTATVTPESVS